MHPLLKDKKILLVTQINAEVDIPKPENLYKFGTLAKVLQLLKLPDGTIKVLVEGLERVKISKININVDFLTADFSVLSLKVKNNNNTRALVKMIIEQFDTYQKILQAKATGRYLVKL